MVRPLLAALLILLATAQDLLAHGGQYTRPGRPTPLGPMTGVPTGDANRFGAGTGNTNAPVPGSLTGPLARKNRAAAEDESWELWWRYNGAALLASVKHGDERPNAEQRDRNHGTSADWGPIRSLFTESMAATEADLIDSAIIACSRSASPRNAAEVFPQIWPFVAHPIETVRRSAVLSIGLLDSDRSGPVLLSFLGNTARTDQITNSVAAIALGYLSRPGTAAELMRAVTTAKQPEVRRAAIVALGLYRHDQREIVMFLLERLQDSSDPQIPIALARLGDEAMPTVPLLRELADDRRTNRQLKRSCIIALGALASPEDQETIDALTRVARHFPDAPSREFAHISLGRIVARGGDAESVGQPVTQARQFLIDAIRVSRYRQDAPWACLGAAIGLQGISGEQYDACINSLLKFMRRARKDSQRGAAAVALGLLNATDAVDDLRTYLARAEKHDALAGHAALALGLLGDRSTLDAITNLMLESNDPVTRDHAASALDLLSPDKANGALLQELEGASTTAGSVWTAQALARVGGPSALPCLVRLARDTEAASLSRAFAIVAVGRILEKSELPWHTRLTVDSNYHSPCQAERVLWDIF